MGGVKYGFDPFFPEVIIASIIQSFHAWFWCLLIFSWAAKFLNKPNKWLNYLNEAVYPTYIVHMHVTALPMAIFGLLGIGYLHRVNNWNDISHDWSNDLF